MAFKSQKNGVGEEVVIKWKPLTSKHPQGGYLLKDDFGFIRCVDRSSSAVDIVCFSFISPIYIKAPIPKLPDDMKWCVEMEDGSMMDVNEAMKLERGLQNP
jgi:hypothetical protein